MPSSKRNPYPKPKGKVYIHSGVPVRVLEKGGVDLHYRPPLRWLQKMEAKVEAERSSPPPPRPTVPCFRI